MDNIFSGLESLGISNVDNLNLFSDDENKAEKVRQAQPVQKKEPVKVSEESLIFEKTYKCPVCDSVIKNKTVKTGKTRLISQDFDLRPRYMFLDSIKYDIVVCHTCGYASHTKSFDKLTLPQAKLIREQISRKFTGFPESADILTCDEAITRHKLALVNAVVKRARVSERAYICLLLGWLTRAKAEELEEKGASQDEISKIKAEENDYLEKARDGFMEAVLKENFPMFGLDEHTTMYIVAALCAETGKKDEALKWASKLIISNTANERIKERARKIKEML